jgi:cell fate regulator YaaT (PSP1 superfamily)
MSYDKQEYLESEGTHYFGVKFRTFDVVYPVHRLTIPVKLNDYVIVETDRGIELGIVALRKDIYDSRKPHRELKVNRIIRIATDPDIKIYHDLEKDEKDFFIECIKKNMEYKIPVKFFKVEKLFDGSRYIIYYKKEGDDKKQPKKINLQPLINELGQEFRTKIEMREVGNRGEAKLFGGLGSCGRPLCCSGWNKKGSSVTVKMAKEQGLAINIPKLSGSCGRLICCLAYERENYQDGRFIRS